MGDLLMAFIICSSASDARLVHRSWVFSDWLYPRMSLCTRSVPIVFLQMWRYSGLRMFESVPNCRDHMLALNYNVVKHIFHQPPDGMTLDQAERCTRNGDDRKVA